MRMRNYALLFVAGCFFLKTAQAQINWSSATFENNITSSGSVFDDSFTFQVGAFEEGFIPTAANTSQWLSKWEAAESSAYISAFSFFAGSYLPLGGDQFNPLSQGYIWGFDQRTDCGGNPSGEWILITNSDWKWPIFGGVVLPEFWTVTRATEVVVGEINGENFHMKSASIALPSSATLDPQQWRQRYFAGAVESISDWGADADGDGLANLIEFATGSSPVIGRRSSALATTVVSEAGKHYYQLTVNKDPCAPIDWSAQVSINLTLWNAFDDVQVIENTASRYVVRDTVPIQRGFPRYLRLIAKFPQ